MKIIIPQNDKNNKIAFDFRDAFAVQELASWKFIVEMFIKKEEARLNRPLTETELDAIKTYFKTSHILDVDSCILVLDKKCVDKKFKDMTNDEIYEAFRKNIIDIRTLDFVKNIESIIAKNKTEPKDKLAVIHRAIKKRSSYSVQRLNPNKKLTIDVPLWENSSQLVDYHEELNEAPSGSKDYVIKFKYSGITNKRPHDKYNNKDKEDLERSM